MATNIHTNNNFRNVGMLEIVNEPIQNPNSVGDMRSSYYPNAFTVSPSLSFPLPRITSSLTSKLAHPCRRIRPRGHKQQLPAHPNDEQPLGLRRPHTVPDRRLFRRLRRPPLPKMEWDPHHASLVHQHLLQRQPRRQLADHRRRIFPQRARRCAVDCGLGSEYAASVLQPVVRSASHGV